ncbi:hypothetical protein E2C01_022181 [Portunus trituberculatus]|uniref:Uncharacterized protein n=1 Tax=Portunus trituberculatus TaxID=210409 RepID=A0A5B7E6K4_PORTR|nr:hypothetical protein [Portunus trituberculatus]
MQMNENWPPLTADVIPYRGIPMNIGRLSRTPITSPVRKEPDGNAYCAPGHLLRHGVEEDDSAHKHHVTQHTHHGHHTEDAADYGHVVGGEAVQHGLGLPGVLDLSSVVVLHADLVSNSLPAIYGLGLLQDEQVDVDQQEGVTCGVVW